MGLEFKEQPRRDPPDFDSSESIDMRFKTLRDDAPNQSDTMKDLYGFASHGKLSEGKLRRKAKQALRKNEKNGKEDTGVKIDRGDDHTHRVGEIIGDIQAVTDEFSMYVTTHSSGAITRSRNHMLMGLISLQNLHPKIDSVLDYAIVAVEEGVSISQVKKIFGAKSNNSLTITDLTAEIEISMKTYSDTTNKLASLNIETNPFEKEFTIPQKESLLNIFTGSVTFSPTGVEVLGALDFDPKREGFSPENQQALRRSREIFGQGIENQNDWGPLYTRVATHNPSAIIYVSTVMRHAEPDQYRQDLIRREIIGYALTLYGKFVHEKHVAVLKKSGYTDEDLVGKDNAGNDPTILRQREEALIQEDKNAYDAYILKMKQAEEEVCGDEQECKNMQDTIVAYTQKQEKIRNKWYPGVPQEDMEKELTSDERKYANVVTKIEDVENSYGDGTVEGKEQIEKDTAILEQFALFVNKQEELPNDPIQAEQYQQQVIDKMGVDVELFLGAVQRLGGLIQELFGVQKEANSPEIKRFIGFSNESFDLVKEYGGRDKLQKSLGSLQKLYETSKDLEIQYSWNRGRIGRYRTYLQNMYQEEGLRKQLIGYERAMGVLTHAGDTLFPAIATEEKRQLEQQERINKRRAFFKDYTGLYPTLNFFANIWNGVINRTRGAGIEMGSLIESPFVSKEWLLGHQFLKDRMKGWFTFSQSDEMKEPLFLEDGTMNVSVDNLYAQAGNAVGFTLSLLGLGGYVGSELSALRMGDLGYRFLPWVSQQGALFGTSFSLLFSDYFSQGFKGGLDKQTAYYYAMIQAGASGMLELISPNRLVGIGPMSFNRDLLLRGDHMQSVVKYVFKEIGEEIVQELSQTYTEALFNAQFADIYQVFLKKDVSRSEIKSLILITILSTGVITGPGAKQVYDHLQSQTEYLQIVITKIEYILQFKEALAPDVYSRLLIIYAELTGEEITDAYDIEETEDYSDEVFWLEILEVYTVEELWGWIQAGNILENPDAPEQLKLFVRQNLAVDEFHLTKFLTIVLIRKLMPELDYACTEEDFEFIFSEVHNMEPPTVDEMQEFEEHGGDSSLLHNQRKYLLLIRHFALRVGVENTLLLATMLVRLGICGKEELGIRESLSMRASMFEEIDKLPLFQKRIAIQYVALRSLPDAFDLMRFCDFEDHLLDQEMEILLSRKDVFERYRVFLEENFENNMYMYAGLQIVRDNIVTAYKEQVAGVDFSGLSQGLTRQINQYYKNFLDVERLTPLTGPAYMGSDAMKNVESQLFRIAIGDDQRMRSGDVDNLRRDLEGRLPQGIELTKNEAGVWVLEGGVEGEESQYPEIVHFTNQVEENSVINLGKVVEVSYHEGEIDLIQFQNTIEGTYTIVDANGNVVFRVENELSPSVFRIGEGYAFVHWSARNNPPIVTDTGKILFDGSRRMDVQNTYDIGDTYIIQYIFQDAENDYGTVWLYEDENGEIEQITFPDVFISSRYDIVTIHMGERTYCLPEDVFLQHLKEHKNLDGLDQYNQGVFLRQEYAGFVIEWQTEDDYTTDNPIIKDENGDVVRENPYRAIRFNNVSFNDGLLKLNITNQYTNVTQEYMILRDGKVILRHPGYLVVKCVSDSCVACRTGDTVQVIDNNGNVLVDNLSEIRRQGDYFVGTRGSSSLLISLEGKIILDENSVSGIITHVDEYIFNITKSVSGSRPVTEIYPSKGPYDEALGEFTVHHFLGEGYVSVKQGDKLGLLSFQTTPAEWVIPPGEYKGIGRGAEVDGEELTYTLITHHDGMRALFDLRTREVVVPHTYGFESIEYDQQANSIVGIDKDKKVHIIHIGGTDEMLHTLNIADGALSGSVLEKEHSVNSDYFLWWKDHTGEVVTAGRMLDNPLLMNLMIENQYEQFLSQYPVSPLGKNNSSEFEVIPEIMGLLPRSTEGNSPRNQYSSYRNAQSIEGGAGRRNEQRRGSLDLPYTGMLVDGFYANYQGRGTWRRAAFPLSMKVVNDKTYTVNTKLYSGDGKIHLDKGIYSVIDVDSITVTYNSIPIDFTIDVLDTGEVILLLDQGVTSTMELDIHYRFEGENGSKQSIPNISGAEYDAFVEQVSPEYSNAEGKLPLVCDLFLQGLEGRSMIDQVLLIEEFIAQSFYYDSNNDQVNASKYKMSLSAQVMFMGARMNELKSQSDSPAIRNKIFAGVCQDIAVLRLMMYRHMGWVSGLRTGYLLNNDTEIEAGFGHADNWLAFPGENGDREIVTIDSWNPITHEVGGATVLGKKIGMNESDYQFSTDVIPLSLESTSTTNNQESVDQEQELLKKAKQFITRLSQSPFHPLHMLERASLRQTYNLMQGPTRSEFRSGLSLEEQDLMRSILNSTGQWYAHYASPYELNRHIAELDSQYRFKILTDAFNNYIGYADSLTASNPSARQSFSEYYKDKLNARLNQPNSFTTDQWMVFSDGMMLAFYLANEEEIQQFDERINELLQGFSAIEGGYKLGTLSAVYEEGDLKKDTLNPDNRKRQID